jgi:hypothetical protein
VTVQRESKETPQVLAVARQLHAAGISVVPVRADGSKAPAVNWKEFQERRASVDELDAWFGPGSTLGVGAVTGDVSGNLLMIEVEGRAASLLAGVRDLASATRLQVLWERLSAGWMELSPSGGVHWFVRLDHPTPGNQKLAMSANGEVLTETRGEGGYSVVAPSDGAVHGSGKPWTRLRGGPETLAILTADEIENVFALFATMGQSPAHESVRFNQPHRATALRTGPLTPGDDYENCTDWADILEPHGWTLIYTRGRARGWLRPGKNEGLSATTGHAEDRERLFVFTTSTDFEHEKPYTKFGAYALLNHGGDHKAAAAALRKQGFGDEPKVGSVDIADKAADPSQQRQLILTPAAEIKPRRVLWLWDGRIALGTLALLAGRQGLGKSTLAYWLAAQITRGTLPGEFHGVPRSVLVCATEDSWEHTIIPRLIAAGADRSKVYRVEVLTADEIHVGLSLPRDNRATEKAARDTGAALLLLDPIISRLGDLDTHRDSDVRQALEPLVAVAARTHMAVLGLIHHNKSGSADPLQLVMGSTAFSAVARSVHSVVPDPDDDSGTLRLFGTPKNNLGRSDLPTLAFTVESNPVETDEGSAWTGRIKWLGEHNGSIADAMRQSQDSGDDRSATKEAADWLEDFLVLEGPEVDSCIVKQKARAAGHSESTLRRAKLKLGIIDRSSGFPRSTKWSFPQKSPVSSQSRHSVRGEELTELTESTGELALQSVQPVQPVHVREDVNPLEHKLARPASEVCPLHTGRAVAGCYTCDLMAANSNHEASHG